MSAGQSRRWFLLLLLAVFAACRPPPPAAPKAPSPVSDEDLIRKLRRSTVTLVRPDSTRFVSYGAGVWLDPVHIVTAFHCIDAPDDDDAPHGAEDAMIGARLRYKTYAEVVASRDPRSFSKDGHEASVVAVDKHGDLALLRSMETVDHDFVDIAHDGMRDGDTVHVVGHPNGNTYTYFRGTVTALRLGRGPYGGTPSVFMYQVAAPIWYGNSGGGAFNRHGELAGIISTLSDVGGSGWAVGDRRIVQFLRESGVDLVR